MKKKYASCTAMFLFLGGILLGQANHRMAGSFTQDDSCGGFSNGQKTVVSITANVGSKTNITINSFGSLFPTYNATATLDSNAHTATLPSQSAGQINLSGNGTYTVNNNFMTISWIYSGGASGSCVDTYTRVGAGIYNVADDISLKIWPSPVTASLHYTVNSNVPTGTLKVFNVLGMCVYTRTVNTSEYNDEQTIDMKSFAAGIYLLQVENGQYISIVKFIKQ